MFSRVAPTFFLSLLTLGLHIDGAWDVPTAQPGAVRVLVIHAASDQTSALHIEALLPDDITPVSTTIDHGGVCLAHGCNAVGLPGQTITMTETVQIAPDALPGARAVTIFVDDDQRRADFTTVPLTVLPPFRTYLPMW